MKKEYLILVVVIAALSAYLITKKENRNNYTLPAVEAFDTKDIDRITLKKKDLDLVFTKTDKIWVINNEEFPADSNAVSKMLEAADLKISALASEKQDLLRYELDDDHSIHVRAFTKDKAVSDFKIGKTAPSLNHTFIMLGTDKNIYHAINFQKLIRLHSAVMRKIKTDTVFSHKRSLLFNVLA